MTKEFVNFIFTGGFAAFINLVTRFYINKIISFEISVVISYFLGMIVAYLLTRVFVFSVEEPMDRNEFFRFFQVNLISAFIVWIVSVFLYNIFFPLIKIVEYSGEMSHFIGVITPIVFSFYAHKFYTFK